MPHTRTMLGTLSAKAKSLRRDLDLHVREAGRLATSLVADDNLAELRVHVGFPKPGFDGMMNFPKADALEQNGSET